MMESGGEEMVYNTRDLFFSFKFPFPVFQIHHSTLTLFIFRVFYFQPPDKKGIFYIGGQLKLEKFNSPLILCEAEKSEGGRVR